MFAILWVKHWGRAWLGDSSLIPAGAEDPFLGFWHDIFNHLPDAIVRCSLSVSHPASLLPLFLHLSLSPYLAPHPPGLPGWLVLLTAWQPQGSQTSHTDPRPHSHGRSVKLLVLLRARPRADTVSLPSVKHHNSYFLTPGYLQRTLLVNYHTTIG